MIDVKEILNNFRIFGDFKSAKPFGSGHINDTYLIIYKQAGQKVNYILRRINNHVFKNPEEIVENTINVTNHIRHRLIENNESDISRKVMSLVPINSGDYFYLDKENSYWCVILFLKGAYTIDSVETEEQAYEAAKAFGRFQTYLADYDLLKCHTTIKDFHNLRKRITAYQNSIEKDLVQRVSKVKHEIAMVEKYSYLSEKFLELQELDIPLRVTHNDTKINNVMLNKKNNKSLCVIDLDTVMPGSVLNDFGDMVRTFTSLALEDEIDYKKVHLRINIFDALVKGYLGEVKNVLTEDEKENLVVGAKIIVYEQVIRFLADYIDGDPYYKIDYELHNFDRTRNQLVLLESIESQTSEMEGIVKKYSC